MNDIVGGDNNARSAYVPDHPRRPPHGLFQTTGQVPRNISKFSGNVLYWTLQLVWLVLTVSVNIVCNPIVWFLLKTTINIMTELFVYLVLGVCSFLITVITHLDDYYTRGKCHAKKIQESGSAESARDAAVTVHSCTVKRFVETSRDF